MTVRHDPPPSKSQQIALTLAREIRSGLMRKGRRLQSESELVSRFAVSRNTVRKGLESLARDGLIATHSGIGSFVTYDGAVIDNALGWTRALSQTAEAVETRVLALSRGDDRAAAAALGGDDDFLRVDRLRIKAAIKQPVSLERSRVPWRPAFGAVLTNGLTGGSLSRTLADAGLLPHEGEEWAEVLSALDPCDADMLGRPADSPVLRLTRVVRGAGGAPVEYVESLLDPHHFRLHLRFGP